MIQLIHSILPYLKYILFFIFIIIFYLTNRKFIKDDSFRNWVMASLSTDNDVSKGSSGKATASFLFSGVIAFASVMAVMHNKEFLMPDYMYISLISFIAAVYGIKMAGRFASNGSGTDSNGNQITKQNNTDVTANPTTDNTTDTTPKP